MANLLGLPDELLLLVISHFDGAIHQWNSTRTLHSPHSFHLTRTIISRPDLAAQVRHANFENYEDSDDEDVDDSTFDEDTIQVLAEGFAQLPTDIDERLFTEVSDVKTNPCLVLLASCMPNLEHLQLVLGDEALTDLEPLFTSLPESGIEQPFLKNLNQWLSGIWRKLDTFTIIRVSIDAEGCPDFDIAPGSLNISSLTFREATLDAERLTRIVEGCKAFMVFIYYEHAYEGDGVTESTGFQAFYLDWRAVYPSTMDECRKVGSLTSFNNICHLELDQYSLSSSPADELPSGLHCLTIRNISFSIYNTLKSLSQKGSDTTLRNVLLEPRDEHPNEMLGIRARLNADKVCSNLMIATKFRRAYDRIWRITKDTPFTVYIDHESYREWEIGCY
ncbi:hypothetical protein BDW59DRAFT_164898 [Aspergillus cavernicola]|uniref:F-box domain-containing protein n=1 Tax=Aspergillus cavernicola TaxID=176166 RepID=A0ABR4HWJ2_9EURO